MIKIKRCIAVLTVVCLMFSFAAITVSGAEREPDYILSTANTRTNLTPLFYHDESRALALYPGEEISSVIRVINNSGRAQTITVSFENGALDPEEINLAEMLDLKITNLQTITNDARQLSGIANFTTPNISFSVDDTTDFKFELTFNDERLKYADYPLNLEERTQPEINEHMGANASFRIIFRVTTVTGGPIEIITTAPAIAPPTTAAPATTEAPVSPTEPGTTAEIPEPTTTEAITEITDIPEPTAITEPMEYEYVDDDDVPLVLGELDDPETPPADPDDPENEYQLLAISELGELIELEEGEIPLGQFLDQLPKTGENTNPFAYAMTGLLFVLAGVTAIIAVSKKTKTTKLAQQ